MDRTPVSRKDEHIAWALFVCAVIAQVIGAIIIWWPFEVLKDVANTEDYFKAYNFTQKVVNVCSWSSILLIALPVIWGFGDVILITPKISYHAFTQFCKYIYVALRRINEITEINSTSKSDSTKSKPPIKKIWERITSKPFYYRRMHFQNALFCLAILDTLIVGIVIFITGGTTQSFYGPVFALIIVIIVILRLPKSTFIVTVFFQLLLWGAILAFGHYGIMELATTRGLIYNFQQNDNASLAAIVIIVMSLLMTIVQYIFSRRSYPKLKPLDDTCYLVREDIRFLKHVKARYYDSPFWGEATTKNYIKWNNEVRTRLKKAGKDWFVFLENHGIDPKEMSRVHEPQTIYTHAIILSMPYWEAEFRRKRLVRIIRNFFKRDIAYRITFLTFASHWVDDFFDDLRARSEEQREAILATKGNFAEIMKCFPRIETVIRKMKSKVSSENKAQVDRAMDRVIRGAFIQNSDSVEELQYHLEYYKELVTKGLSSNLQGEINKIFSDNKKTIWTTSKVVMELFHSCCGSTFDQDIAEVYTMLYAACLYYQDIEKEKEKEGFGAAFSVPPHEQLPNEQNMIHLIDIYTKYVHKKNDKLYEHRIRQLHSLLWVYDGCLKEIVKNKYYSVIPA